MLFGSWENNCAKFCVPRVIVLLMVSEFMSSELTPIKLRK